MKKILFVFAILFPVCLFYSCEEVGPYINLKPEVKDTSLIDTTYISALTDAPQTKMILIEDFTGVQCPNCPNAAQKIEDLQTSNPDRILAVGIHFKGTYGDPFKESKDDFRTNAGKEIYLSLPGVKGLLPMGSVNRTRHYDDNNDFVVLQQFPTWPTYVNEELAKNTPVNIDISGAFVDTSKNYKLKIKLHYTQATTDTQALTIYLIEDNIIDLQMRPNSTIDSYYVHKHILRAVLTNFNGNNLDSSLVLNRVYEKEFKIAWNPKWVKANCSIIAFVHKKGGYYFDIIHAKQKPVL
jgi:hypothetical protein